MRTSHLFAIAVCCLLFLALAPPAQAQQMCDECSACYSACDDPCFICRGYDPDGGCLNYVESTCGQRGTCIGQGCCPSYSQTGYELVGTYGNGSMFSCSHHSVYKVTMTDSNNCETPNYYQFCDDVLDGGKSGWFPDCCDGNPWTCNGWHSCF